LVFCDHSLWLHFRSWAARKLLVEADYALHTGGILGGTNSLFPISLVLLPILPRSAVLGAIAIG
jgi:hypothetical protein